MTMILFTVSFAAQAQNSTAKVEKYLNKFYPDWKIGESWIIDAPRKKAIESGDFNGDGKTDYAVLIEKDGRLYALALLADKNSFKAYNLLAQNSENKWIAGVDIAPKGEEYSLGEEPESAKKLRLKNDGIFLYDGEGMGRIFYWQNNKFLSGHSY